MKGGQWKWLVIGLVIAWAAYNAWPREGRRFFNMKLGLDLKGGSYLVMQVQTEDAVKARCDQLATGLGEKLRKEGFPTVRVTLGELGAVVVTGAPPGRLADVETAIKDDIGGWALDSSGETITLTMPHSEQTGLRDSAVQQALKTIRNRVDAFGVGETNIQRLGGGANDRIVVELPGVEDPSRVKRVMQTQAQLELRLAYYRADGSGPFRALAKDEVLSLLGGQLPPGVEILPYEETDPGTEQRRPREWMVVERAAVITGGDLQSAERGRDDFNAPAVDFHVRVGAAQRFASFTRANINRQMPIVLDGKIVSAPVIRGEIGLNGQISGRFTEQAAEDLALQLRAGALPARVVTLEERTVGPSLGADSIAAGLRASLLAAGFTCVFMLVYYKLSGLNAIATLALNMFILFGGMAQLGAALTLPGIAGLALTVGMAVDANVLIFERMREEIRAGRTVAATIDLGFKKALAAILDSNLTTIIAALFLFEYGTGPVRGFAVTLIIGLIANVFTAVFVSRTIFETALAARPIRRLSV